MIEYHYEGGFKLKHEKKYTDWITRIVTEEGVTLDRLSYIFCSDEYLHKINLEYLEHDFLTDVIGFDYGGKDALWADIFISVDRVADNAEVFGKSFGEELLRVMAHGVLHMMGYDDKNEEGRLQMRNKEEEKIKMFHVEQL